MDLQGGTRKWKRVEQEYKSPLGAQSTFPLPTRKGGGGKVLLRYFLPGESNKERGEGGSSEAGLGWQPQQVTAGGKESEKRNLAPW